MAKVVRAFDDRREFYTNAAANNAFASSDTADQAAAELLPLQAAVIEARRGLDAAQATYDAAEPVGLRSYRENVAENQAANAAVLARSQDMQIWVTRTCLAT